MKLDDFEWSRNPRGMHWDLNAPDVPLLKQLHFGLVKLVTLGGPPTQIADLLANNITPIVRIYRREPGNAPPDALMMQQFREHLQAGVKWFELYNEPNLKEEWLPGSVYNPRELSVMAPLMDNWLNWAEFIIEYGGYPGLPALSEAAGDWEFNGIWTELMLNYLYEQHFNRFLNVLGNGCWVATHPGVLNHFYQEVPGGAPTSARPPHEQNAYEGGWHFEYPYDPISQATNPGAAVWGPKPEPIGLIAGGLAFMERLQQMFGVGAIPVIGTEGGIFVPRDADTPESWDNRYPPYTWHSHATALIAMFRWIVEQAPPWMFGVTLWTAREYWEHPDGLPPALETFRNTPPVYKSVPPTPTIGELPPTPAPPSEVITLNIPNGPGPVHGAPDYHFIYLAPEIDAEVFFASAHEYWATFLPGLLTRLDYLDFLTVADSVVLTVIATDGEIEAVTRLIREQWVNVVIDPIPITYPAELVATLQARVIARARFG